MSTDNDKPDAATTTVCTYGNLPPMVDRNGRTITLQKYHLYKIDHRSLGRFEGVVLDFCPNKPEMLEVVVTRPYLPVKGALDMAFGHVCHLHPNRCLFERRGKY